ncbi:hypothetical protein L0337_11290 [candidate division KSB1 bacterium]|nr:hypothetical protein [candidate division KSB1 bacterium]
MLDQLANGMSWDMIVEEWRDSVTKEAIAEAVRLSSKAFIEHADEYMADEYMVESTAG